MPSWAETSRWRTAAVLMLAASGCSGESQPPVDRPESAVPFRDAATQTGLVFQHDNGMSGQRYIVEIIGPGSAVLDYDHDGDLDVFLVQGCPLGPELLQNPDVPRDGPTHCLFRNDSGGSADDVRGLRFTDVTQEAGVGYTDYGMGVAVCDYDGDGHEDLFVTCFGRNRLLRNTGSTHFNDVTAASGLGDEVGWSTSASWLDYDGDGHPDLFVCRYLDWDFSQHVPCQTPWGAPGYCGPGSYTPARSRLYRGRGDGTFENVSDESGIAGERGAALGVVAADFDGDGGPDLFVANDGMPNHLWMNQHNGQFQEEALLRGCGVNADGMSQGNMGIIAADFFHHGRLDLFITHLRNEHAVYYRNLGDAQFADVTASLGLDATTRPYTGFGTGAIDYDNDGWLDIFATNGDVQINEEQLRAGIAVPLRQRCLLFRNTGAVSPGFEEVSDGEFLATEDVGRGAAFADLDNDGDTDIIINNNNGPARLLLNQKGQDHHWLGVQFLDGAGGITQSMGAVVWLERNDQPTQMRRAATDGSYLTSGDPRLLFGLGTSPDAATVRVKWGNGQEEAWHDLAPDRYHPLQRGTGRFLSTTRPPHAGKLRESGGHATAVTE